MLLKALIRMDQMYLFSDKVLSLEMRSYYFNSHGPYSKYTHAYRFIIVG